MKIYSVKSDGKLKSDTTKIRIKQATSANTEKINSAKIESPDSTWKTDKAGELISAEIIKEVEIIKEIPK